MLPTTMATTTLTVSSTGNNSGILVWIQDLNAPGRPEKKGQTLKLGGQPLRVPLQEVGGNAYYHSAAEELVDNQALHWAGRERVPAVSTSGAGPTLTIDPTKGGVPLPYMFRPYP
jgi:hypothetical protein